NNKDRKSDNDEDADIFGVDLVGVVVIIAYVGRARMDLRHGLQAQVDAGILGVDSLRKCGIECGDVGMWPEPKVGWTHQDAPVVSQVALQKGIGEWHHRVEAEMRGGGKVLYDVGDHGRVGGRIVNPHRYELAGCGGTSEEPAGQAFSQRDAVMVAKEIAAFAVNDTHSEHCREICVGAGDGIRPDALA